MRKRERERYLIVLGRDIANLSNLDLVLHHASED